MSAFLCRIQRHLTLISGSLHLFRAGVLVTLMLFSITGAEGSSAGDTPAELPAPATEPAPATQPVPAATPPPTIEAVPVAEPVPAEPSLEPLGTRIGKSADETHDNLQRKILEQVVRLDNFFGYTKADINRQTRYEFRLRNALRVEDGNNFKYGPSIRANIVLSKINERLRLSVAGDNEPPQVTPSLPEDPGNPGFDRTAGNAPRFVNTELRYGLIETPSTNLFLGAGVRVALPLQAFARSRFQYTYHLSDTSLFRFGETFFVRNPDGPGATTELTLEKVLDDKNLLRWASTGTAAYEINGVEWGSELSHVHEFSPKSAITVMGGVYGNSSVNDTMSNYRLLTRYRRNFMRKWLFYELEPEIFWPRANDGQFTTKVAFTFRLDVVFEGTAKK